LVATGLVRSGAPANECDPGVTGVGGGAPLAGSRAGLEAGRRLALRRRRQLKGAVGYLVVATCGGPGVDVDIQMERPGISALYCVSGASRPISPLAQAGSLPPAGRDETFASCTARRPH
jgi:hypothetical protein